MILFNCKRSGEVERMIVKGFYDLKRGGYVDLVVKDILFEFEKYFCKMYLRVEILGKIGWKVFVLFMKVM